MSSVSLLVPLWISPHHLRRVTAVRFEKVSILDLGCFSPPAQQHKITTSCCDMHDKKTHILFSQYPLLTPMNTKTLENTHLHTVFMQFSKALALLNLAYSALNNVS